jgi:hypothetical protein
LANVFDKLAYKGQLNISIFRVIPKKKFSKESQKTITSILTLRNKTGSHLDSVVLMAGKELEEHYGLDFPGEKIRALIKEAYALLNQVRNEYGYSKELDDVKERKFEEQKFEEWYKVFEEKYSRV